METMKRNRTMHGATSTTTPTMDIQSKTISKRQPTYFLFIGLLLISLLSIYEQEKALQAHNHNHNHNHNLRPSKNSNANDVHEVLVGSTSTTTTSNSNSRTGSRRLNSAEPLFGDAKGSAKILLRAAQKERHVVSDYAAITIDHDVERARCARYKLSYTPDTDTTHGTPTPRRRRIFWGASIADDSWHVIAAQAIETHGLFHTVAFVESNRTSMANPRELRFGESSENRKILTETGMFGPDAKVSVDNYVNEEGTFASLEREHEQRSKIIERWKMNGMTKHDIGYLSDTDETFTRDFLRAVQICDVSQFVSEGKDGHNKCAAPKVYGLVAIFEGSPECVSAEEIYQPGLMIGECIEGIGDPDLHPAPRRHRDVATNWRDDSYTYNTYYSALHDKNNPPPPKSLPSNVYFPLWNAADYRRHSGGFFYGDDNLPLYVGYHIHNMFDDMVVMRKKYLTYGHAINDALTKPLSDMNREVNLMIRCAKHDDTHELEGSVMKTFKSMDERRHRPIAMRKGGLGFLRNANYAKDTGGAVPLAFRIEEYVTARQNEMVVSVEKDERERLQAISNIHHEKK